MEKSTKYFPPINRYHRAAFIIFTEKLYVFSIGKIDSKLIHAKSLCGRKADKERTLENKMKKGETK